jgi:hypothetical protein
MPVIDALAGASADEVAAALTAVGTARRGQPVQGLRPRTPLPDSGGTSDIHSDVVWV